MQQPQPRHHNNFDFLRLLAALMVVFGHASDLNERSDTPLALLTNHQTAESGVGVMIFFAISGYLICGSFLHTASVKQFVKSRLLRIIPGLAVAVLLTVFVLGPLVTVDSTATYFDSKQTWQYLQNILPWGIKYQLPGVFTHNPHGPNGSLWTIPLELRCYVAVLLLGITGLLRRRGMIAALCILLFIIYDHTASGLAAIKLAQYLTFALGAAAYLYRDKIPMRWQGALWCCAGLAVATYTDQLALAMPPLVTYLVLYLAQLERLKLHRLTSRGDFSYGIYIYAFPIQQLLIHLNGGPMQPMANFLGTLPLVLTCAVLSWFLIEKPALSLKSKKIAQ